MLEAVLINCEGLIELDFPNARGQCCRIFGGCGGFLIHPNARPPQSFEKVLDAGPCLARLRFAVLFVFESLHVQYLRYVVRRDGRDYPLG